jgi:hypothetical protein
LAKTSEDGKYLKIVAVYGNVSEESDLTIGRYIIEGNTL